MSFFEELIFFSPTSLGKPCGHSNDKCHPVLRDPSIATSTLEQRVSFLKSKNLTQEEIDVSIARAGGDTVGLSGGVSVGTGGYNGLATQQFELQQRPGYGPYQGSPWGVYSG